jgi:hypothetical protein
MADRISGFFWLIFSVIIAEESYRLELGTLHSPKAGFLPFWASLALGVLSSILLLSTSIRRQKIKRIESIEFNKQRLHKVFYVLISLFLYGLLLNTFGFLLCTILLIFFLIGIVETQRWYVVIITTILIPFISYMIFAVWLRVQMPRGFLGF